jgi:hypothetical protein
MIRVVMGHVMEATVELYEYTLTVLSLSAGLWLLLMIAEVINVGGVNYGKIVVPQPSENFFETQLPRVDIHPYLLQI